MKTVLASLRHGLESARSDRKSPDSWHKRCGTHLSRFMTISAINEV
jgi:hypothetical protein